MRLTWPPFSSVLSWSSSSATSPGSSSTVPSSSWWRRCSGARPPSPPPTITYAWPASTTGSSLSTPPLTSLFTAPWGKTSNWLWLRLGKVIVIFCVNYKKPYILWFCTYWQSKFGFALQSILVILQHMFLFHLSSNTILIWHTYL